MIAKRTLETSSAAYCEIWRNCWEPKTFYQIAEELNMNINTVKSAVGTLVREGWLTRLSVPKGQKNLFKSRNVRKKRELNPVRTKAVVGGVLVRLADRAKEARESASAITMGTALAEIEKSLREAQVSCNMGSLEVS